MWLMTSFSMSLVVNWHSKTLKVASKNYIKLYSWSVEKMPRTPFCAHPAPTKEVHNSEPRYDNLYWFWGKLNMKGAWNQFSNVRKKAFFQGGLPFWLRSLYLRCYSFLKYLRTIHAGARIYKTWYYKDHDSWCTFQHTSSYFDLPASGPGWSSRQF